MSVRLVYKDIAVGADEDASVSTTAAQPFSRPAQLPQGVAHEPLVTLEPNSWLLGGDRKALQAQTVGFWSTALSGTDGVFASPHPALLVEFDQQYTSLGVSLVFDAATGEYCSQVTVRWYQGTTLLHQQVYHPDSVTYFCAATVEHYNRVEIRLDATALPRCCAKLSRVLFGIVREFQRNELRSVRITEDINLISEDVSINTMDFTLDSKSGVDYIFQRLQPIFAYNDDTLVGAFFVEKATKRGPNLYDLSCNDALGVLDYETIPAAMYSGKNAKTALEEILDGIFELDMAEELQSETLTGYRPEGTRRDGIHHIAFALRAVVDTSGTDKVRVFRPQMTGTPTAIPKSRIYTGGSMDTSALVTEVRVTAHSYSTSGSGESITVAGATYYDTQTTTVLKNPNVTSSDKQNVVEIRDATLINPSNVAAVAQGVYNYYTRRRTQKMKIVTDGELPGDLITTATPWGEDITGNVVSMSLTLSGFVAADCEVVGT